MPTKKIEKTFLSTEFGKAWASFAPEGALNMLATPIPMKAGRYMKPSVNSGSESVWVRPVKANPIDPVKAMGSPAAAEVETASFIVNPCHTRKGTIIMPPPTPANAQITPIRKVAPKMTRVLGSVGSA